MKVSEVLPVGASNVCVVNSGQTVLNATDCGGENFSKNIVAKSYLDYVLLRKPLNSNGSFPSGVGCDLSPSRYNYCGRYAQPSSGSLSALPCAFNGSNCTTTFSATKSSARRSCLWRIGTPTTKLFCSEDERWSLPGWNGLISGHTLIELRASNDRDEPADYNPAQKLLDSVTLQTCFGPGQFPAAPGIPNLA